MLRVVKYAKKDSEISFAKTIAGYCAAFLLLFLSLGQNTFALTKLFEPQNQIEHGQFFIHSLDHNVSAHSPLSLPNAPGSNSEDSNEKENNDNTEDEFSELCFTSKFTNDLKFSITEASFLEFKSLVQNRRIVSLYVLHHAWKSCLS